MLPTNCIIDLLISIFLIKSICQFVPSTQVKITVLDRNDSPPEFRDQPLHFAVSEDLGAGHTVATLRANDPDTIGTLTYTLVSGDSSSPGNGGTATVAADPAQHFQLDSVSGVLTLRDTLDRETNDEYELVVRVSDGIQFTEATVKVQVSGMLLVFVIVCVFCTQAQTTQCNSVI